jgi:hypothetical protein
MPVSIIPLPVAVAEPKFRIFALGENGKYPTIDFLENLKAKNEDSYNRLIAELSHVSENGPITNDKRKSRLLQSDPKIYEFKTKDLNRITWFYDKGSIILCTHGYQKPKPKELKQEIKVAVKWHKRYCADRDAKKLKTESI